MTDVRILAIDLAKRSFQVCATAPGGAVLFNQMVSRAKLEAVLREQAPCIVAMEACAMSHFWGRFAQSLGHEVRLIPPIYVKPFVKRQKNDAADAAAIAEAALRPNLHYVAVKSAEHQARAVAFRTHQSFVGQRTQLINALRGHLAEFGLVVPQGPANLKAVAGMIDDDAIDLPNAVRDVVRLYLDQIALLTQKIDDLHFKLRAATKVDDPMRRLCTVPGVGPVTAGAIMAFAPDMRSFASGRNFAAWLGLVPRQRSTGGKTRLGAVRLRICNCRAWRCRSLEGFMDLSALAGPKPGRAVSGLTEANVALTRSGLCSPSDYLRRSFVPAFPRGTPPSDQL